MIKFEDEVEPRGRGERRMDHSKACAYTFRGEKCQRTSTTSHSTKGEGPWYCGGHLRGREPSEPHGRNWRDVLVDSLLVVSDGRRAVEAKFAYRTRHMDRIRSLLSRIGKKLPYDPDVALDLDERAAIQGEGLA